MQILLIDSRLIWSTIDFFVSVTDIAFSNAILLTILLHSVNLTRASRSFGCALATCNVKVARNKQEIIYNVTE